MASALNTIRMHIKEQIIKMKKALYPILLTALIYGCSSTDNNILDTEIISDNVSKPLYLRGDFTLWEAQESYLLSKRTNNIYSTKVKFGSIGKAYEFKIADSKWSKGYNCGFKSESLDKNIELGIPVEADCNIVYNYFSFTPYEAGWYEVSINFKRKNAPLVTINQVFE